MLDAASRGTRDGLHLALNIAAMLISFLGLVALVNLGLIATSGTSLQRIVGWVMAPVAYMMGVAGKTAGQSASSWELAPSSTS